MGRFNAEMIKAGIMLAADGLQPSAKGARVAFAGGKPRVVEPPFAQPNELIAGFWIIDVASKDEAVAWAMRAPFEAGEIEIRPFFEVTDFLPEILPAEDAARERAWREQRQAKAAPPRG
jgi:hypothetical protein